MTLPDRYASGFALWRAEHPESVEPKGRETLRCPACGVDGTRGLPKLMRVYAAELHVEECDAMQPFDTRAACVRLLAALPELTEEHLPWLRALPQQDQDVVVVARARLEWGAKVRRADEQETWLRSLTSDGRGGAR